MRVIPASPAGFATGFATYQDELRKVIRGEQE